MEKPLSEIQTEKRDTSIEVVENIANDTFSGIMAVENEVATKEFEALSVSDPRDDPDFQGDPDCLYLYNIAIGNKERRLANFINLIISKLKFKINRVYKVSKFDYWKPSFV